MSPQTSFYRFGPYLLDVEQRALLRDGEVLRLTSKSFDTLLTLVEGRGLVVEKDDLMKRVWPDSFVEEANLAVNISVLRKLLGEMPDGRQYIETLPRRGYRLAAPVSDWQPSELAPSQPAQAEPRDSTNERRAVAATTAHRYKLAVAIAGIVVVCAAVGSYFGLVRNKKAPPVRRTQQRLAVLPFTNNRATEDKDLDYIGFSLADAIITQLGQVNSLIVRPSSSVEKYRDQEIDPIRIANELKVDSLLTGRYVRDGDHLIITVQLEDVGSGSRLWGETINIEFKNLLTIQNYVTQRVTAGLKLELTAVEDERLKRNAPHDARAYELFLRAIPLISTSNHRKAIELLTQSVEIDPNYALAWAFLGRAHSISALQYYGGAKDYAEAQADYEQALVLNPENFQTRLFMANLFIETNRVEEAIPLLRAVAETNPTVAFTYWELSYAYRYAGMLKESVEQGERALQLDPDLTSHVFNSYFYLGEYSRFIASLPSREDAYVIFYRGLGNYYLGDLKLAAADFDRAYELDPSAVYARVGRAFSLAIAGKNLEGLNMMKTAEAKAGSGSVSDGEITYKFAQAYAALNDKQSALRALKRSIDQGFFCYPYLVSDPLLENLRGETEYYASIESARRRHEEFKRRFF